jgi:hypothetical protein
MIYLWMYSNTPPAPSQEGEQINDVGTLRAA